MAQMRREPVIINQLAPSTALSVVPYRILSCPVRNAAGRTTGVLALFRHVDRPHLTPRDARQVGRAWCRERVCPVVCILLFAVALQPKLQTIYQHDYILVE